MWLWLLAASPAIAVDHPDFSGVWVLDAARSDDADALLAAWGFSWVERQLVKAVTPTQTIQVQGEVLTLVIDAKVMTRTETLALDGSPQTSSSRTGGSVVTRTVWDGAVLVTRSEGTGPGGARVTLVARRTLEEGGAVMRQALQVIQADGSLVAADRVFRKR